MDFAVARNPIAIALRASVPFNRLGRLLGSGRDHPHTKATHASAALTIHGQQTSHEAKKLATLVGEGEAQVILILPEHLQYRVAPIGIR